MANVFGRRYSLIIGRDYQLTQLVIPKGIVSPKLIEEGTTLSGVVQADGSYLDFCAIPRTFFEIKDVQMKAKLGSSKKVNNNAEIELYNINNHTKAHIREDDFVVLKAGYDQDVESIDTSVGVGEVEALPTVFVGQVVSVTTTYKAPNEITKIILGDAITVTRNVKISKSWPPGVTRLEVMQGFLDVAKANGIPTGKLVYDSLYPDSYNRLSAQLWSGYTTHGMLIEELLKFCKSVNMKAYTVLGRLYIEPTEVTRGFGVFTVKPDQIIGRINPAADNSLTFSGEKKTNKIGLEFSIFLNARVTAKDIIRIEDTESYDGEYSIDSVAHSMDYRGTGDNSWATKITCTKL